MLLPLSGLLNASGSLRTENSLRLVEGWLSTSISFRLGRDYSMLTRLLSFLVLIKIYAHRSLVDQLIRREEASPFFFRSVRFNQDGTLLASGSEDQRIRVSALDLYLMKKFH